MTDTSRQDKALNVMGVVTLLLVVSLLGIAILTVIDQFGQGDTLDAQARTDEIAGCRSEYSADVTSAQQDLDDADSDVDDAESRRNDLVFLGLVATATDAPLDPLVEQSVPVSADIAEARAHRQDARSERDRVTDRRDDSVTLSRRDPAAFLERCRRDFG